MMFGHAEKQAAGRRQLAADLRALSNPQRRSRVKTTVIDTGGTLIMPRPADTSAGRFAELTMLGLYHSGDTLDQAINNWIKAAFRATALPCRTCPASVLHP